MEILVNKDVLNKCKAQDDKFIVCSFDLPCENFTVKKETEEIKKLKKVLATTRIMAGYNFYSSGVRLNKSVYIIATQRINDLLSAVESLYANANLPEEHIKKVNIKLVGTVFEDTVMDLLTVDISHLLKDIKGDLELLSIQIANNPQPIAVNNPRLAEKFERERKKILKFAYTISKKELIAESRIADINLLNNEFAKSRKEDLTILREQKRKLMVKI